MEVKAEEVIVKEVKSKGRVTLGSNLEGKTVEIAILDVRD
jgi:hypothetical protein